MDLLLVSDNVVLEDVTLNAFAEVSVPVALLDG